MKENTIDPLAAIAAPEPEQAKVTAKRYTAIISEKRPIPVLPRLRVSQAL